MQKRLMSLAVAASIFVMGVSALAKVETVRGVLIDRDCYLKDPSNNAGVDHQMPEDTKDCAISCAKIGQPVALLTEDGKVITILGGLAAKRNEKLVAHMGQTVEITGDLLSSSGRMTIAAAELRVLSH